MPNYINAAAAASKLRNANRILVIGCSGGGKSTLSHLVSQKFELPIISLDKDVRWLPGWVERERNEQRALLADYVNQDRWVIDGSGASSFDIRLPRTDLVLWVSVPRHIALLGVYRRVLKNYGRVRHGMAEGCPEKLPDRDFLSYIWFFNQRHAPVFKQKLDEHGPEVPVLMLKSHSAINRFMQQANNKNVDR